MDNTFIYNKLTLGVGHYVPMTYNEVGNSIYIKASMNVIKFEMYHGERYSQDVNKNCHALSTPEQMVSSMLGPPLPENNIPTSI